MRTLATLSSTILVVLGLTACGGKAKGPVGNGGGGGGRTAARLPFEAALTVGAEFVLYQTNGDMSDDGQGDGVPPAAVKVTAVEEDGGARVYRLAWTENTNGPDTIRVEGTQVTIGSASAAEMKEPWAPPGGGDTVCYGADFSNPDGCDDVCDADLCLGSAGVEQVTGLYAPNYSSYAQR